jgi:NAD(P)-dependent dehydrogenase (short-subunit alcohol dehydrogenase family)
MSTAAAAGDVALVTGTSSGFGLLASVELLREGFRVFATMRDTGKSGPLLAAARAAGVSAALEVLPLDVTQPSSIAAAVDEVGARAGRIDVLVNNAGVGMIGFFEDTSLDELRAVMETNFFGLVAVTQAVVPGMRGRRKGRIINVSSVNGRLAPPGSSAYAASKFALEGMSEALRLELLEHGVYVILVEPGMFRTEITGGNRRVAARAADEASPYRAYNRAIVKVTEELLARARSDPMQVARLIVRAATVPNPRLRWLVGRDASLGVALRALLPTGTYEATLLRYLRRLTERLA